MPASARSSKPSGTSPKQAERCLSLFEREKFVKRLLEEINLKKASCVKDLAKKAGVGKASLWRWFSGAAVRRSVAQRAGAKLGWSQEYDSPFDRAAITIPADSRLQRLHAWRACIILADSLDLPDMQLELHDRPVLRFGATEVRVHVKDAILRYRVTFDGQVQFEGDYDNTLPKILKEFLRYMARKEIDRLRRKKKNLKEYERFNQSSTSQRST